MGCPKCKKNKCCCSNNGTPAQLQAQVDVLQEAVNDLVESTKFLKRHPILLIRDADDIALFDPTTKLGTGDWEGWAMCVGGTHQNPVTKAFFTTPNLIDRFVVMATGTYAVNDTGGSATVQLTANQNGTHAHAITDNGHTHNVTDPGHNHGVTDNGHTHAGATAAHTHSFTTDTEADHTHALADGSTIVSSFNSGEFVDGVSGAAEIDAQGTTLVPAGSHNHGGTTDPTAAALVITNANTGVAVDDAFVGITETDSEVTGITIANQGLGEAHENLPPYFAAIYIQKVF
jgi:microcystin-dependent protein